jgi:ADP-ribose pyrophosphatase YjhB (NUDIX family)
LVFKFKTYEQSITAGTFLNKELLICHPTNHPLTLWSIPKGKVESGEFYVLRPVTRKPYEETNIDLKK